MRYQRRLFACNSLTGSTPSSTGNTANIHHLIADRTSHGSTESWSYFNDAAPTMAKLKNRSRLVDLSPSSLMRASSSSSSRVVASFVISPCLRSELRAPGLVHQRFYRREVL